MVRDKSSFLASVRAGEEEKLLISHIEDMLRICDKTYTARFSAFLTEAEAALAGKFLEYAGAENYMFYGGYENAGRVILGVFPQYEEPSEEDFPIERVKFYGRGIGSLTHRDFLGSLMGLGITRGSAGDIVRMGESVYAMLSPAAAQMAVSLTKIGREGVKSEIVRDERIVREDNFSEIGGTIASLRLDCVIVMALRVSREKAAQLIRSGSVSVNHGITESVSETLNEGDVLSVRGHGRFILERIGDRTKKDRIHITVKKYL